MISAPVAIAVVGCLTLGTATTAAAGHLITGKDIKDHSIAKVDLSKSTVKSLHGARGRRGPKGGPATQWYGAHITSVITDQEAFGSAIGFSQSESSTTNFVDIIGPDHATTLTRITAKVQNAPGVGSSRTFALGINGDLSDPCTMGPAETACTITLSTPIPAYALLYIDTNIVGGEASGADAAIGWQTVG
jgi:hypothetical protein